MAKNHYIPKDTQKLIKHWKILTGLNWNVIGRIMYLNPKRRYRLVNDKIHMGVITFSRLLLLNSFLEKHTAMLNPLDLQPMGFSADELQDAFKKLKGDKP